MKMSLVKIVIASLTLAAASAMAFENNFYLRAGGGYNLKTNSRDNNMAASNTIKTKGGYAINAAIGYRFMDIIRFELEAGYMDSTLNSFTIAGTNVLRSGSWDQLTAMGNAIVDFQIGDNFFGYLGAGIGTTRHNVQFDLVGMPSSKVDDWVFAYQGMTGLGYNITDSIAVTGGYRIMGSSNPSGDGMRLKPPINNIFEGGITFRF